MLIFLYLSVCDKIEMRKQWNSFLSQVAIIDKCLRNKREIGIYEIKSVKIGCGSPKENKCIKTCLYMRYQSSDH